MPAALKGHWYQGLRSQGRRLVRWRLEGSERQRFEVLHDGSKMELVACAGQPAEPHAFEAVVNLQMSKAHLDALALVTRLEECLRPHQAARQITCILMDVTGDLSCRHVGATLHFERADIAIELGSAIAKCVAVVHGSGGV